MFQHQREELTSVQQKISQLEVQLSELRLHRHKLINEQYREESNLEEHDEDSLCFSWRR
jgi:hypothetical protein